MKFELLNAFNNQKLITFDTTVSANWAGAVDALGIPTTYTQGPRFGQANSNASFPNWRSGNSGSRAFLVAAGGVSNRGGPGAGARCPPQPSEGPAFAPASRYEAEAQFGYSLRPPPRANAEAVPRLPASAPSQYGKGVVMGAMVLSAQPKAKAESKSKDSFGTIAEVAVSIDSVAALPPYLAYDDLIDEAATLHDVDPDLVHAVIEAESGFNALAESLRRRAGAHAADAGLQAELGVTNPFDARQNIMAGVRYLKTLLERHKGNVSLALASPTPARRSSQAKGVPPHKETRNYIKRIKALLAEAAVD